MRREAKHLLEKAVDALILSIELFNRPSQRGRITSTLIHLDHSFEMLLKASIVHRGGSIHDKRTSNTIGFDACVNRSLSDSSISFLLPDQASAIRVINSLRDAAQHYLLDISEGQLYFHIQSGLTVFREVLRDVFSQDLSSRMPDRVLPVSTSPPRSIEALFASEMSKVRDLLRPGKRRRIEGLARLRALAILNNGLMGDSNQPSDRILDRFRQGIIEEQPWESVFPGVASVEILSEGSGPGITLRFAKKEDALPIQITTDVSEETPIVGLKRVNELDYYNLSATQVAGHLKISVNKLVAIVEVIGLRGKEEYYKEFRIGSVRHKRYSRKAIAALRDAMTERPLDDIWREYSQRRRRRSARHRKA